MFLVPKSRKGLELNIMIALMIGIVGLLVLLSFFSGPVQQMMSDTFCFFNNRVFGALGINLGARLCQPLECKAEQLVISPVTREELITQIAAPTILCWKDKSPKCGKTAICYEIVLKNNPLKEGESITESDFTDYLEKQGACGVIENSKVFDQSGQLVNITGCGDEDLIVWNMEGNVIKGQSLILIQYDLANNKIWIKA